MKNKPRNKRKIREIQRNLEIQNDIVYLNVMNFELKQAENHHKLQKRIHKKQGWREYTR